MSIKEFLYFNKRKIIILVFVFLLFLLGGIFFYYISYIKDDGTEVIADDIFISSDIEKEVVVKEDVCFFDIKGEVKKPGVYSIECNKRINDAIVLSGGLTKNGDTSVLNLSKKIEDGMVIIIYSKKEITSYLETLKKEEQKNSICSNSNIKNDACINSSTNNNQTSNIGSILININTASLSELMRLSGIGEAKAKNIILYREKTPFKNIEDILNVEGIGESIYVNIKENITV